MISLLPALLALAAPPVGAFSHRTAAGTLTLTLAADGPYTLEQTGQPTRTGAARLEGPSDGPWQLVLVEPDGRPGPVHSLRALPAGRLGLSGGALAFEVVLDP
jgi:hypothetical protein